MWLVIAIPKYRISYQWQHAAFIHSFFYFVAQLIHFVIQFIALAQDSLSTTGTPSYQRQRSRCQCGPRPTEIARIITLIFMSNAERTKGLHKTCCTSTRFPFKYRDQHYLTSGSEVVVSVAPDRQKSHATSH